MRNFAAMFRKGQIIGLLAGILMLTSCSEFQKVLKDGTKEEKFKLSEKLYEKGSYYEALQLYDELLVLYRNDMKIRDIYYRYAYAYYNQEDYVLASYHFKYFARTFPKSEKAQECLYMSAYCKYLDSSPSNLDQQSTDAAIREMQLFINMFPKSPKVKEANEIIDKLRAKLIIKDFEKAKSYYVTEYFKSATYALKLHPKSFPSSPFIEESYFLAAKSSFLYSKNSVVTKQTERYEAAMKECDIYMEKYPSGAFSEDVIKYKKMAVSNIASIVSRLSRIDVNRAIENVREGKFESAINSYSSHSKRFPKSELKEKSVYLLSKGYYKYAANSAVGQQKELFQECVKASDAYLKQFPEGKYKAKASKFKRKAQESIEKL